MHIGKLCRKSAIKCSNAGKMEVFRGYIAIGKIKIIFQLVGTKRKTFPEDYPSFPRVKGFLFRALSSLQQAYSRLSQLSWPCGREVESTKVGDFVVTLHIANQFWCNTIRITGTRCNSTLAKEGKLCTYFSPQAKNLARSDLQLRSIPIFF